MEYMQGLAMQKWAPVVARVLLALVFIMAGIGKITGFAGTAGFISSVGLPMPEVLTILAIIVELGGGLLLLFGYMGRIAAKSLFVFTLIATVIFHNNLADQMQVTMALKNLAIMGGLLLVMLHGSGPLSVKGDDVVGSTMNHA